jgi:surface polysaccharide O-acyltransferase-like enzyme
MVHALVDHAPSRPVSAPASPPRPPRDQFIDLLRATAVITIVCLHWLMPVVSYDDGVLSTANAPAAGAGWAITWVAQVMPLIFFAGGAAAAISLDARRRRPGPDVASGWVAERLLRIGRPVLPLAAVLLAVPYLLIAAGLPAQPVEIASALVGRLLWFLAAYVLLIIFTPALLRLHTRAGGRAIAVFGSAAIAVDLVRFGWFDGAAWAGYPNVLLVWGAVYLAGVHYGRGHRWRPRRALAAAGAAALATALAVGFGPYPAGVIGMPDSAVSNMNPPSAALLGVAVIHLGVAMAALRPLVDWASRRPVTELLGWISRRTMTIYLWHIPALVAVSGVALIGFGYATPDPVSSSWRDALPAWLALLTGTLAVLTRLLIRFENPVLVRRSRPGRLYAGAAAVLIGGGLLILTVASFSPAANVWPIAGAGALALGVGLASGRISLPAGWARAMHDGRLVA